MYSISYSSSPTTKSLQPVIIALIKLPISSSGKYKSPLHILKNSPITSRSLLSTVFFFVTCLFFTSFPLLCIHYITSWLFCQGLIPKFFKISLRFLLRWIASLTLAAINGGIMNAHPHIKAIIISIYYTSFLNFSLL